MSKFPIFMSEESKLTEIFNSFDFSKECKLIKVQYNPIFFGNFLLEIQYGHLLFRIINDRNLLFIDKYDTTNMVWSDIGYTSIKISSNNLKYVLYDAFNYINTNGSLQIPL